MSEIDELAKRRGEKNNPSNLLACATCGSQYWDSGSICIDKDDDMRCVGYAWPVTCARCGALMPGGPE